MLRPVSVEAHYLAEILKELHRLRLAVERLDRRLRDGQREERAPNTPEE